MGIALISGGAVAYFTFLRPSGPGNTAQETLDKYFEALASGDTSVIKSFHASDMQPPDEELQSLSSNGDLMTYKDIELKTIEESGSEMEVEIVDYVVTISTVGYSESIKMSKWKSEMGTSTGNMVVKLKKENGKWLVNEPHVLLPLEAMLPKIPDIPAPCGST
ncbi:MAG: hypothetical protein KKF66_02165 [Actinobacteria bacterium]|nr:hypothetical protein [Actinomycetota bacterium]